MNISIHGVYILHLILVISHHKHSPAVWNSLNNNDFVFKYNTTLLLYGLYSWNIIKATGERKQKIPPTSDL